MKQDDEDENILFFDWKSRDIKNNVATNAIRPTVQRVCFVDKGVETSWRVWYCWHGWFLDLHFEIQGITPGKHTVVAWTPYHESKSMEIDIQPGKPVVVELKLRLFVETSEKGY